MDLNGTAATPTAAPTPGALIKDSSTAEFARDVIEASREAPVLVDFWAPWCGPCRTLSPALEKVVNEKAGAIRLVKINVDENQALAGQFGIQSIPSVFAFAGGRPVDGFMGALPESEVRRFAERIISKAPPPPEGSPAQLAAQLKEALAQAREAFDAGDLNSAMQVYGLVLQHDEGNAEALIGVAQVYLKAGEAEQAQAALELVPEEARKSADYLAAAQALKLMGEAAGMDDATALEARIAADPGDLQARYDLAVVHNAAGRKVEAAETLVALMKRDREWNEDGARKKLLELFEAWGPKDPATLRGRRLLSALLFS